MPEYNLKLILRNQNINIQRAGTDPAHAKMKVIEELTLAYEQGRISFSDLLDYDVEEVKPDDKGKNSKVSDDAA